LLISGRILPISGACADASELSQSVYFIKHLFKELNILEPFLEKAIASSIIEGAAIIRKAAKRMLR
jgi:hypothetical protein